MNFKGMTTGHVLVHHCYYLLKQSSKLSFLRTLWMSPDLTVSPHPRNGEGAEIGDGLGLPCCGPSALGSPGRLMPLP